MQWANTFKGTQLYLIGLVFSIIPVQLSAETLNVAVASNFVAAAEAIKAAFEQGSEHKVRIISGSSGKHYAQILSGAPFDVFLSADQQRPQRLVEEGHALAGSLKTYALGQLMLWSANKELELNKEYLLNTNGYRSIAIPNPRLAPYGQAAVELLSALSLYEGLNKQLQLVTGENVAQVFQFAFSRNADLALAAYSQTLSPDVKGLGSYWLIPDKYHQAIKQDMVLLKDSAASREFAEFLSSELVETILLNSGYLLPPSIH